MVVFLFILISILILITLWIYDALSRTKTAQKSMSDDFSNLKKQFESVDIDLMKNQIKENQQSFSTFLNKNQIVFDDEIYKIQETVRDTVAEYLKEKDSLCKCAKCGGVCRPKVSYCPSCGEKFFKDHPSARITSSSYDDDEEETTIRWECLICRQEDKIELTDAGKKEFIILTLECDDCGVLGEIVHKNHAIVSKVFPYGTFDLANCAEAF